MTKLSHDRSKELYAAACKVIPGGVNSPVRAFRGVGGNPLFIDHAKGPCVWDVDGNQYVDYVLSWGPLVLGHAPDMVIEAIREQAEEERAGSKCKSEASLDHSDPVLAEVEFPL